LLVRTAIRILLFCALCLGAAGPVLSGTLSIAANTSDPAPRAAWQAAIQAFQREHPDIEVKVSIYDHESYKKAIRQWLTGGAPDVVFWFAGQRMREFTAPGLLEDVSDLFTPSVRAVLHRSAVDLVSADGRQYGVPYTYYQLGFYFRRDVLDRAGIPVPRDWHDLLAGCNRLKAAGVEPFAIGSKDLWPTAAWFDYIDLRLNGHAFHMALMNGEIAYTDPRVRAVFDRWRELLDRACFARNHASMGWQEAQALLYQGQAAMMLIGNYIVPNFPPAIRDRMDFAPFPVIDATVGRAEEAPVNTLHIPARAVNKSDARLFLAFVLRADIQEALNRALVQIPVNKQAAVADDRFLRAGSALLSEAEHLSQFFDRDTSEDLATVAMKGFQEFMLYPERLDAILANIERARVRIFRR
jgi:multiple sugar transport system substrate-binding protein